MGKKGQSLIFEQVLLFGISVALFVVMFAVFTIYQGYFLSVGGDNQLDEVKEWVSGNILKLAEKDANSSVTIPIPRTIESEAYVITADFLGPNPGLKIKHPSKTKTSSLYSLNTYFSISGSVASVGGKIIIKKENNQIIIS